MKKKLHSVQFLRFLASFLVIITHSGFYTSERLDSSFDYWKRGSSGVILFFVISGFVMIVSSKVLVENQDGWKIFAVRRLLRIAPIYWMATSVKVVAMILISNQVLHSSFDIAYIIKSYFFVPSYNPIDGRVEPLLGVGWTLVYEMSFYILFTLTLFLRLEPVKFVGSILLFFALGSFSRDLFLDIKEQPLVYFLFDSIILNFIFGMTLGRIYERQMYLGIAAAILAIVVGLMSIVFNVFGLVFQVPSLIGIGLASFFVIWGCFSLEAKGKLITPSIFVFLGAASYSTYLFHPMIAPIVPTVFKKIGLTNPYMSTIGGILLALAVSSAIYVFLERPLTSFLAGRIPYGRKNVKAD